MVNPVLNPHGNLWKNLEEVNRLLAIHSSVAGKKAGRKYDVNVLNKSAIVLLVACWEAFVEDLAETAFSIMLNCATEYDAFPQKVLVEATKSIRESENHCDIWKLAGDGWKQVLQEHKKEIIKRHIGKLNTPLPKQVDELYEKLLGIKHISFNWHWKGMNSEKAKNILNDLIEIRGGIAHRVSSSRKVFKNDVRRYIDFVNRISVTTSNSICQYLRKKTGKKPWPEYKYDPRMLASLTLHHNVAGTSSR